MLNYLIKSPKLTRIPLTLKSTVQNTVDLISLTECNSDTIQKLSFGVNTVIERKNVTTTSDNTGTLLSWNIPRQMSFLWDAVSMFLSSKWTIFGLCHYRIQWSICPTIQRSGTEGERLIPGIPQHDHKQQQYAHDKTSATAPTRRCKCIITNKCTFSNITHYIFWRSPKIRD